MALMACSPLKRDPERLKSHRIVDATITVSLPIWRFSGGSEATVLELRAHTTRLYFPIDLAQQDVDEIAPLMFRTAGPNVRRAAVTEYLASLDDTALLDMIAAARARRREQQQPTARQA